MNEPTAQMGFQLGKSAVDAGQQYMEQNVSCMRLVDSRKDPTSVRLKKTPSRELRVILEAPVESIEEIC